VTTKYLRNYFHTEILQVRISIYKKKTKTIWARKRGSGEIWHRPAQLHFRKREKEKKYLMVLDGTLYGDVRTMVLP
jgi:hypothetical protein